MSDYIKREDVENMLADADLIFDGEYLGYCRDDILIDKIPAADVTPVKHGKWIGGTFNYFRYCSECNKAEHYINILNGQRKYCPNCGARMDLEE